MFKNITHSLDTQATRHYARVMAFAVLGLIVGYVLVGQFFPNAVVYAPENGEVEEVIAESPFERSAPVRLIIPKIDVDTTFVPPLGLNADQTVSVPDSYEEVGWYKHGATPGEIGTSVILGHVDSYEGPAVFFKLGQLKKGDEFSVERADGTTATLVVTDSERVDQDAFPTQEVYAKVNHVGIRLVTCTGIYDHGSLRYSHNLIVYGELKDATIE